MNDRNLFNILDDVDMDLISGELDTGTNNFDMFFNEDNTAAAAAQNNTSAVAAPPGSCPTPASTQLSSGSIG